MKNRGCALELILVLAILIALFVIVQSIGLPTGLADFLKLPQPTPTILIQPAVIDQIKPLGQLHTSSYFLSTVVDSQKVVGALGQQQRVLLVACGKVSAGIDLQKLTDKDIKINGTTATITLPPPEIFDASMYDDRECTYVALRENGILLPPDTQLEEAARQAAVANFRATAEQNGILQSALDNAKLQLRSLIILLGYKDVNFIDTPIPDQG